MRQPVEIENIAEMRRREGIEDEELEEEIRRLQIGDAVKLTFLTSARSFSGETLQVRITQIRGEAFRGKLAGSPASPGLSALRAGSTVAFTADHIHSVVKQRPKPEGAGGTKA